MAEFTEVMKQAKRMCSGYFCCADCPLDNEKDMCIFIGGKEAGWLPEEFDLGVLAKAEKIVMDWAAKHSEPRYPSWNEAWRQLFPYGQRTPCPGCFGRKYASEWCGHEECGECKNRPIPADIAEKLGIKPIGRDER